MVSNDAPSGYRRKVHLHDRVVCGEKLPPEQRRAALAEVALFKKGVRNRRGAAGRSEIDDAVGQRLKQDQVDCEVRLTHLRFALWAHVRAVLSVVENAIQLV